MTRLVLSGGRTALYRLLIISTCCTLLLLSACSTTTFVYNRLDFLLPWYLDDYVDLTRDQKTYLDRLLQPFLQWHRREELPVYVQTLDRIEASLDQPSSAGDVALIYKGVEAAWFRLQDESLPWLLELGADLSAEQVQEFEARLQEQQEEFEQKYLARSEREYRQDSYDNLLDSMQDYLGRLDKAQRNRLREASEELRRSDDIWLEDRAAWLEELAVLLQRDPGWQQRLRDAIARRDDTVSVQYRETFQHNMRAVFSAIADVLNSRTDKQDLRFRRELGNLRDDLQTLIDQGVKAQTAAAA